jgi:hypothetical protein
MVKKVAMRVRLSEWSVADGKRRSMAGGKGAGEWFGNGLSVFGLNLSLSSFSLFFLLRGGSGCTEGFLRKIKIKRKEKDYLAIISPAGSGRVWRS